MFLTFNSHLIARLQALTSTWWCCTAAVQIACCVHCLFWVWSIVSPSPWESTLGSLPQSCFPIIELVRCCLLWVLLLREFFTSFYPSSEGSMRSTLLHPPIIPHYDHITPVIHTVTQPLDPLLQPSFILLYPCNTQKLKLLLLKEPNGHYKGTLLPSVNTDVLNQKYCLYFLSELSVLSIIGLELETNGIIHCA